MNRKTIYPIFGFCLLAACGGGTTSGGGGASASYTSLFDTAAAGTSGVSTLTTAGSSGGELDRSDGSIDLGGLTGTYDPDTRIVTFDLGGIATIESGTKTEFVSLFSAEPEGTDPFQGTIGVPTAIDDIPNGTGHYASVGGAKIVIIDSSTASESYALSGDVDVIIDFDAGLVDIEFFNLDGTNSVGGAVNDVATFEISEADLTDGMISGGTAAFSSAIEIETNLSLEEDVTTNVGVFGPEAAEVGGIVEIDDSSEGDLYIFGAFTANSP